MTDIPDRPWFIDDEKIPMELRTVMLQDYLAQRAAKEERREALPEKREEQRQKRLEFWHNTPLVVALVGVITIVANGSVSWLQNNQTANASAAQTEREFSYNLINTELAKTEDPEGRAKVLLFLTRVGILTGLNQRELEAIGNAELEAIAKASAEDSSAVLTIPPTIGQYIAPSYDEPIPAKAAGQTDAAYALLTTALGELNNDVDEQSKQEIIDRYWSVVPNANELGPNDRSKWSAAFVSWAVNNVGNPDQLPLAAAHRVMWGSALAKGIVILPPSRPLPGDIAFFTRSGSSTEQARKGEGQWLGWAGIVNEITPETLTMIVGNQGDALRTETHDFADATLVGYIRIGKKAN